MLEEGKVNLCLRNVRDWKVLQRNLLGNESFRGVVYGKLKLGVPAIEAASVAFEENIGSLLICCLSAVETAQTTDVTLLVQHVADVLQFALDNEAVLRGLAVTYHPISQEVIAPRMLGAVLGHLEHLSSERIIDLVVEHGVLTLLLRLAAKFGDMYAQADVLAVLTVASAICDLDAFLTRPDSFLPVEVEPELLALCDSTVAQLVSALGSEASRPLRALRDYASRLKLLAGGE